MACRKHPRWCTDTTENLSGAILLVPTASVSLSALPPLVVLIIAVGFTVYCLFDLGRAPSVRYLPRWAWAVICVVSEPLGGILYLLLGRTRDRGVRP